MMRKTALFSTFLSWSWSQSMKGCAYNFGKAIMFSASHSIHESLKALVTYFIKLRVLN